MFQQVYVAIQTISQQTPIGAYQVDADALRKARQGTPAGEYHSA